ncbi:TonB-dependent receptor plug domain-containing protein [Asticcacaulis tiandongensis]|uniref:TonB-dependent receptor plug domain-containing protein n=1 Tax=Asticcacaulis tiandongensis TaxID=2565365 RepID=UPI001128C908|nr:TonB-dependent receptor plug domain-containing protein [Asticcacaulis tiandongensis]
MQNTPKRSYAKYLMGGTGMAMLVAFAAPVAVQAQEAADDVTEVVIVGARAAQQSAIDRQRRAKTPTESIVADDIGDFPDRNINEAISRIAGVALDRNDFGEGGGISIRGNQPGQTRVELDGMGVASTRGDFAISGGDARGASLTELPTDLIKSVDVVKGQTADMTEGSIGGGVQITTRSGLDFRKPYLSFRAGAQQNSLGKRWTPNFNVIASRKFLDDRLGVIFNGTYSDLQNNAHKMQNVTSGTEGYARDFDFDNSPDKTFTFNPSTVSGDLANTIMTNSSYTPLQIVTMSSQAATKDACLSAFPLLLGTETAAVKNQRIYEQQTCLNQWNDYTPSLNRSFMNGQNEKRYSADLRFDYRVNDRLTVYAKYNLNNRDIHERTLNRSFGEIVFGGSAQWEDEPVNADGVRIRNLRPTAEEGWYHTSGFGIPNQYVTGVSNTGGVAHWGNVINVKPGSVTVDDNHHVTQFTLGGNNMTIDEIDVQVDIKTEYAQFGGTYNDGPLKVEFMAAKSKGLYSRDDMRTSSSAYVGDVTFSITQGGLWSLALPEGFTEGDPVNYMKLFQSPATGEVIGDVQTPYRPAYTVAQRPAITNRSAITFEPRLQENEELSAKFDVSYDLSQKVPFFTLFKAGAQYRDGTTWAWGAGVGSGYEVQSAQGTYYMMNGTAVVRDPVTNEPVRNPDYVAPIVVPTLNQRGIFYGCQETLTSIEPCNYGFHPGGLNNNVYIQNQLGGALTGVHVMTVEDYGNLISSTFREPDSVFFGDYPDRGDMMSGWPGIDVRKRFNLLEAARNFNFDCMKSCTANDGKVYDQPMKSFNEKTFASYYMVEFEQDLPLGLVFNGNVGVRRVEVETSGTGQMVFNTIRKTAGWDPDFPDQNTQTTTTRRNVSFSRTSVDWLPSYNFNLWLIPNELVARYYTSKTVSRPNANDMLPIATCTIDERREANSGAATAGEPDTCGAMGNPGLRPYTAWNESLNVEWYPNRDTMFSLAYHKLDVRIGGRQGNENITNAFFAGTDVVNPVTGAPLNQEFAYGLAMNGDGQGRKGWEFSTKTAFTFLPWYLRYTGADLNYSKLEGDGGNANAIVDPNSGDVMRPVGESDYFANLSVWYDDGRTNARISYQARGQSFDCITSCQHNTTNNYAGIPYGRQNTVPFNPGYPKFTDETKYIDAKITHKIPSRNVELFIEGRNMTKQAKTWSGGSYNAFAGGEANLFEIAYGGRRVMVGFTYRN